MKYLLKLWIAFVCFTAGIGALTFGIGWLGAYFCFALADSLFSQVVFGIWSVAQTLAIVHLLIDDYKKNGG